MKLYSPKTKNTLKIENSMSYCPKYSLTRNKLESERIFETSDYLSTIHVKNMFLVRRRKVSGERFFSVRTQSI